MTAKKKVLQIVADGEPGGGTTFVLGLCEDLKARNQWEPVLITNDRSFGLNQAKEKNIKAYGLDFFKSRFDWSLPAKILAKIKDIKPDIIHLHGSRAANPFCFGQLKELNIPLIYTVHGYHFQKKPWPIRFLFKGAEQRIAQRVNHVVFVSNGDKNVALQHKIISNPTYQNHSVIYNGINPSDLELSQTTEKKTDVIFIGRMYRQKNPFFIIDILKELKDADVRFQMVGGGEMLDDVKDAATQAGLNSQIEFTGFIPREEVIKKMQAAKIYIQPSLWEGLPITPIEASYCKLPIIASDIPGTDEVVIHNKNGILIEEFSAPQYAAAIKSLLKDTNKQKNMGEYGRKLVHEKFLRSISSNNYIDCYNHYIDRKG